MKKLNHFKTLVLLVVASTSFHANAQELKLNEPLSPYRAVELAKQEFPNMLQLIEPSDMKDYGFDMRDNFSNIQIGQPFYVVSLPTSSPTESLSLNPNTVLLPVILDGRARCLLFVSQEEGQWKVVGIGEGNFVRSNQAIFNSTDQEGGAIIVSIPQLSQQFLLMQDKNLSFKPMIQFENTDITKNISFAELIELNNKALSDNHENPSIIDASPSNSK